MYDPEVLRSLHVSRFKSEPEIFAAPGRVNLIGEHTDYAEGFVMPAAIDFATLAGVSPRDDGKIVMYSENFKEERTFDAALLPKGGSKDWSDYPLGVMVILAGEGHRIPGLGLPDGINRLARALPRAGPRWWNWCLPASACHNWRNAE